MEQRRDEPRQGDTQSAASWRDTAHGGEARTKPTGSEKQGGRQYTCPMDPDVVSDKPGECPQCGMALEPTAPEAPVTKTEWTCPMHSEVVRDEPGECPECGMALEPREVSAQAEENPELKSMTRRFWVSVVLTVPVLFLAMGGFIPGVSVDALLNDAIMGGQGLSRDISLASR